MEKYPPLVNIRHPFLQLVIAILLIVPFYFLVMMVGVGLIGPLFHINAMDFITALNDNTDALKGTPAFISALKFLQGISEMVFLAPALVFALMMGPKNNFLKLNRSTYLIPVLLALAILITAQPIVAYLQDLNENMQLPAYMHGIMNWMRDAQNKADAISKILLKMPDLKSLIINIVIVAAIPAFCEEAFFRGTIQQILGKWIQNKHVVVWTTAIIFSAVHGEFFGFVPRMVLGAVLGYLFLWSGNLWYSIIGHMTNNGLGVIVSYLYQAKIISYNPDSNDTGPMWLTVSATILMIGAIIIYHNYFKHHPPDSEEEEMLEAEI